MELTVSETLLTALKRTINGALHNPKHSFGYDYINDYWERFNIVYDCRERLNGKELEISVRATPYEGGAVQIYFRIKYAGNECAELRFTEKDFPDAYSCLMQKRDRKIELMNTAINTALIDDLTQRNNHNGY